MTNRFAELLAVLESDSVSNSSIYISGKRRELVVEALRIAAASVLAPIDNASDIEKKIVGRLVVDVLAAGYSITVWNGGDEAELTKSSDADAIFKALAASDQDELVIFNKRGSRDGWIRLVWGNDVDVISDYTTNLEKALAAANALANELDS
jgi:hypothetical protein